MNHFKIYLAFLLCFACAGIYGANVSFVDSLVNKLNDIHDDARKIKILDSIVHFYNNLSSPNDNALKFSEQILELATHNNYEIGKAMAFEDMGKYYDLKGDGQEALSNYLKAIPLYEAHADKGGLSDIYDYLSVFYRESMKNDAKALQYSLKSLALREQLGNTRLIIVSLNNTGNIYFDMYDDRHALQYYLQALDKSDKIENFDQIIKAGIENNVGSIYLDLKVYDTALAFYQKALSVYQAIHNDDGIATCYGNMGDIYILKGDADQGIQYSLQALPIARKENDKDLISNIYSYLTDGYSKKGDYKNALLYQTALSNLKDTVFKETSTKQVNDMQVKYDTEKKEKENKILELNINRQKLVNYSITIGLVLVTVLVFFIYRGYVNKKKAHEELAEKNKIIEEKNKDILDSINYAKTIQTATLTPDEYLQEELKEYFIVYKPRDVVSGDFYWCHARENKVIFAVTDCTGHGVPGAFMSMIGNSLLNEVVIENKITDAAQILSNLRTNLLKTLLQKGQNTITRDGMDIALCVWDKNANTLQFSGANNPMYLMRSGLNGSIHPSERIKIHGDKLVEFLPDKQPIGYYETRTNEPFHSQTVQLQKGDIVYISTDGYVDQFGGDKGKKFTKRQFKDLLCTLSANNLQEQKQVLDKTIEGWKGANAQTDDICLMGVKFS